MGFVGLLKFALSFFFDCLAWPIVALGYPLYCSIRAIETNSKYHMRKLVTYWTIFSVFSLFELTFLQIIEWIPYWSFIKLLTVCWLVLPCFEGSCHAYQLFVHPCLSLNVQAIIKQSLKQREERLLNQETFLAEAERYVKENGSDALEKLIATKPQSKEPDVAHDHLKVLELEEKNASSSVKLPNRQEPGVGPLHYKVLETKEKIAPAAVTSVNYPCANVEQCLKGTVQATEIKKVIFPAPSEEKKLPEKSELKKVQKSWRCDICQVTTQSEITLNSHLQGRKHKSKCEELKQNKLVVEVRRPSPLRGKKLNQANKEAGKTVIGEGSKQDTGKKPDKTYQGNMNSGDHSVRKMPKNASGAAQQSKLRCSICNVSCCGEIDMAAHVKGKKHLSQIQAVNKSP